jgi:hypothetical protein
MRNAKFWINKTSNQNIEEFTIHILDIFKTLMILSQLSILNKSIDV